MINKWNKKLRSNTGSSLILVLMLFFLCVMVSSVVVGVATSSAGRITKREQQQQGYLSVVSAVELAVAEMKNCGKFTGKETATDYGCNEDEDGRMWWVPIYYDEIRTEYHESDADSNSGVDIWEVDAENTNLTGVKLLSLFSSHLFIIVFIVITLGGETENGIYIKEYSACVFP